MTNQEAFKLTKGDTVLYDGSIGCVTEVTEHDGVARVSFRLGNVTMTTTTLDPLFDADKDQARKNLETYNRIPLIMVFEDLQQADDDSLSLLVEFSV
jgi:hypothetical protein